MILFKTEAGHQVLKDRSVRLTPRQRSAFILFDGRRSVSDVLDSGTGISQQDIEEMIDLGLLSPPDGNGLSPPALVVVANEAVAPSAWSGQPPGVVQASAPAHIEGAPAATSQGRSEQQRYKDAYPIATQLTGSLGLRGFRLNLAVEGTSNFSDLLALAPKIQAAVGPERFEPLDRALNG